MYSVLLNQDTFLACCLALSEGRGGEGREERGERGKGSGGWEGRGGERGERGDGRGRSERHTSLIQVAVQLLPLTVPHRLGGV